MSGQLIGDLLSVGGKVQEERDRLAAELRESELLRKEAAAFSETMRQELAEVRVERDRLQAEMTEAQRLVKAANLDKDCHKDMYEESHAEVLKLRDKIKALTEEPVTESELGGMLVTLRKDNKSLAYQLQHAEQRESACIRTNLALEDRLREERKCREKRVAELQEERDKARHKLEHADDRIADLEQAKGELQAQLEAAAVDTPTNEQLAPWRQVTELQAQLQEAEAERDHQKELLAVFRTQQRLIDAIFRNPL